MERIKFTGERFVPGIEDEMLEIEHMQRYHAVVKLVEGKKVLDVASGEGYGSHILSNCAKEVIGVDISQEAVDNATRCYGEKDNLSYQVGSIAELPFEDNSFDAIVSFETIEHVTEELQNDFLKEAKRVLKKNGIFIISTPNKEIYSDRYDYANEYHIKEFYVDEFVSFLKKEFKNIKLFRQFFEVTSIIDSENRVEEASYIRSEDYNALPKYVIAVAGNEDVSDYEMQSIQLGSKVQYLEQMDRIIMLQNGEEERNRHIAHLDREIEEKNAYIGILQNEVQNRNEKIEEQRNLLQWSATELREKEKQYQFLLNEKEKQYQFLLNEKESISSKAIFLEKELLNKSAHIEQLLEVERAFEREKNTRLYKMNQMLRKVVGNLLPANSRREFVLYLVFQLFRHPVITIKTINGVGIGRFLVANNTEKMKSAWGRYYEIKERVLTGQSVTKDDFSVKKDKVLTLEEMVKTFSVLEFKKVSNPMVSIVIPVYNQFEYTYKCLKSILENSGNVSYEIIIADDCSTDYTKDMHKFVTGIQVIHNKQNLRFLLNCNNAASYAKGKYILFLNNDTTVNENWLQPLVSLIEADATIGMVGSKLLYPDGTLQEAGGILWKDGSAWNYGNRQNSSAPEFNYVRDVDYISGAAIMIRSSLWKEIGGFDENFAPAYYEDTDLAFEVRKRGKRVVYQPLSEVVHFEGVSNGTDVNAGQKAYQVTNAKKFYEKWKDILEKEHFPNAENVFTAKDRSRFKKHILVVDHYVPNYDKDAGGRCTYMYLKAFLKLGMKVTFIGDNFAKMEPYATELNQLGIEILYGDYYCLNWQTWLKENLHYFDYVYLQRPHISVKYIDLVKEYGRAKIFYFAHDLHYIREYREYLLNHDEEKLKSSEEWKKIEYDLFEKTDVGHVVGSYEQEIMQKAFPNKPVRNIPLYIYEEEEAGVEKDFAKREDIMYVGGFGHPPNEDAVLWFANEVFPKVLEKYPDMKWHVVGSKVTEKVSALASENIIIEGFLSDEDLHKLYHTCRMSIVPLRYGAGVKGKVVEAAYFQIPLVTTSIGAEGLACGDNTFVIEDDAEMMAQKICELYENYDRLKEYSDAGKRFIEENFTLAKAEEVLLEDMIL